MYCTSNDTIDTFYNCKYIFNDGDDVTEDQICTSEIYTVLLHLTPHSNGYLQQRTIRVPVCLCMWLLLGILILSGWTMITIKSSSMKPYMCFVNVCRHRLQRY